MYAADFRYWSALALGILWVKLIIMWIFIFIVFDGISSQLKISSGRAATDTFNLC